MYPESKVLIATMFHSVSIYHRLYSHLLITVFRIWLIDKIWWRQNLADPSSPALVWQPLAILSNTANHAMLPCQFFPNDWAATVQRSAAAWKDRASTEVKPCTCRKCQMSSICQGDPQDLELCPAEKSFKLLVESVNVNSLRTGNHHLYMGKSTILWQFSLC